MSTKTPDELLKEAENVSSVIADARNLMANGKTIDLSDLEGKIEALCENAESTDLEQSPQVRNALSAIVEDLNQLNHEMSTMLMDTAEQSIEDSAKRAIASFSPDGGEG